MATLIITAGTLSGNSASSGGGIYNNGTLTLTDCTFSGNSAGEYGGGIYNTGTATLTATTLSGNMAAVNGGGIYNRGTLTLTTSTLSGNSAANNGGGISNVDTGTLTVTASTLDRQRGQYRRRRHLQLRPRRCSASPPAPSAATRLSFGGGIYSGSRVRSPSPPARSVGNSAPCRRRHRHLRHGDDH